MLKYQWNSLTITTPGDFNKLKSIVTKTQPQIGAVDTETSGLHIINDKPFVVQFGFLDIPNMRGFTFAVDLEHCSFADEVLTYWESVAHNLKWYMGHNVKFDLHMLANIGHPYEDTNLTDTMFWIRYGHDARHPEEGGPVLGLKDYARHYIDNKAKEHEKMLAKERSDMAKKYNNQLKFMLNNSNAKLPEKYNTKSFTISVIHDMFNDCIFEVEDLPEDIKTVYLEWFNSLPLYLQNKVQSTVESDMIRYNDLNRETLLRYAHYDIVYTLEIWSSLAHIVQNRKQEMAIDIENKCLLPWYEMERTGFKANKVYLEECKRNLKKYIKQKRSLFYKLADEVIGVNQNPAIKRILNTKYKLNVPSTGNDALDKIKAKLDESEAKQFIEVLQELRTLEKWYSVYIVRFLKELKNNDRLYTSINQVGTVSGRVTSDFQQFPKKGIKDDKGNELFHPRKIIYTDTALVYLDYSQIELRFQALYTVILGHPDYNMCRAYMPYDCYMLSDFEYQKVQFDYNDPNHIKNYKDWIWYHNEDNKEWHPVDVHGATTTAATGKHPGDPDWDILRRDVGKRVNFAKNYGAELGKIREMFPDKSYEECVVINDAYYKAFPGIKLYHEYCAQRATTYSYTPNLFGVKYYNVNGHKLKNMLIQGSAAFYLKWKIIELYDYCKKNNIKTKFQMQIHDELSWEYDPADPPEIFFIFKRIMEDWKQAKVPIIADMEASNNTWASKTEVNTLEELKEILQ